MSFIDVDFFDLQSNGTFHRAATSFLESGLCVIPSRFDKHPVMNEWKGYQSSLPVADEIESWFLQSHPYGMGFVCGKISGGLEVIDLDAKHDPTNTLNARAEAAIKQYAPGLWEKLPRETTPSGGLHLFYRCPVPEGNLKLARQLNHEGKLMAVAETRGEGGFIVASPSPGYAMVNGELTKIPFISDDDRASLLAAARSLDQSPKPTRQNIKTEPRSNLSVPPGFVRAGDAYDQSDAWKSLLTSRGWTEVSDHAWRRPGKERGISATWDTLKDCPRQLYVFTPNAYPLESEAHYSPFALYTHLECGGDWAIASDRLREQGFGTPKSAPGAKSNTQSTSSDNSDIPKPVIVQSRGLFEFQLIPRNHSSVLLGNRYVNRGDIAILVGSSGMGKSSMSIQLATELSLNRGPFGILGNGPSRHLIIQSEDSDGDVAEVAHSIAHILKLTSDEKRTVSQNVRVITDRVNRGLRFITALRHHIAEFKPDFVWLNPLQAFIDGDITDSQDLGAFLREGLNSLNEPPSFAYFIVHHTTKPATGKERSERQWHEVMYDMAGGAEIINSARAILSLRATATEGEFNLVLAKRGRRAGVTRVRPNGAGTILEPVTTIPLKHAGGHFDGPDGKIPVIFWEGRNPDPATEPVAKGGRPKKYDITQFISIIPRSQDKAMTKAQLLKFANDFSDISETVFREVLNQGVKDGLLVRTQKTLGFVYHLHVPEGSISEQDV